MILLLPAFICFPLGAWLLFYSERLQRRITSYHDKQKRTFRASPLFLRITEFNYEGVLRLVGGLLILASLVLIALAVLELERGR